MTPTARGAEEKTSEKQSKSGPGGKRKGAGRKRGVRNKVTQEIGALCRTFNEESVAVLYELMWSAKNEGVRRAAADSLLDRGNGKPTQALVHSGSIEWGKLSIEQLEAIANSEE